eukprot:2924315-Prymnesium_polylepis.1
MARRDEEGGGAAQGRGVLFPRWLAAFPPHCAHPRSGPPSQRARDEMGRKHHETATMRAQNVTWASDNRSKRDELRAAKSELEDMRSQNSSVVAQVRR